MNVQVLVAAMNQNDHSLLQKMKIHSDVIVGNQGNQNSIEKFDYEGYSAIYLNFAERGVGLNRNNALMRATGDVVLFADDDMIYCDHYEQKVIEAFESNPKADIIVFNIVGREQIKRAVKVNRFNYLRYGTARIGAKLESIKKNGIYFNQCFGGGTEHCHGEDNLFLTACLQKKLKIIAVPVVVASLTEERGSTWKTDYDDKFIRDQGCLYRAISRRWWKLLCLQDAIRHHGMYGMGFLSCFHKMTEK